MLDNPIRQKRHGTHAAAQLHGTGDGLLHLTMTGNATVSTTD
jgi:hypothetical protein